MNLALSVLLVQVLPGEWRVAGVVLATVVTTLLVCHVVEPYVVFGHVFGESPRRFWVRMYACVGLFAACALMVVRASPAGSDILSLAAAALMSLVASAACVGTVAVADAGFRRALLGLLADVLSTARSFVRR